MFGKSNSNSLEILITVIGIILTGLIGYGQWDLGRKQLAFQNTVKKQQQTAREEAQAVEKKTAIDLIEMQALNMVGPYLGDLGVEGDKGKVAERVVGETVDYLSNTHSRTSLANIAKNLIDKTNTVSEETRSRIAEATEPAKQREVWFSVLASLNENEIEKAKSIANEKLRMISESGESFSVEVWKTKISKNFAIVVGGSVDNKRAIVLARKARKEHWADDAFAQVDKEWKIIGAAPF